MYYDRKTNKLTSRRTEGHRQKYRWKDRQSGALREIRDQKERILASFYTIIKTKLMRSFLSKQNQCHSSSATWTQNGHRA